MATATTVPLDVYLHGSYEREPEWIDGEIRERGVPDEVHSAIQRFFVVFFSRLALELGVRVRPELRLHVASSRYRIPAVSLLAMDAPFGRIPTEPPLLCVEILSPDDRAGELYEKIEDYVAMGVANIWVVDPRRRKLLTADADGLHPVAEYTLGMVRIAATEIFAELDGLEAE